MRNFALLIVCGLACGCGAITESILGTIADGFFPEVTIYDPSEEATTAPRLAFVASDSGNVACYILDGGGSDPIMEVGAKPNGIAVGTSGTLFVSTEDHVVGLDASWSDVESLPVEVTTVDGVAADAGLVVVAGRTDEGAVVLVYDEISRALVGRSAPMPGVTITDLTVGNEMAFAVEAPTGEIVSFDLTTPAPARAPVAETEAMSGEPVAIVVGDAGNLFVANTEGRVEEIDIATGEVEDTLFLWDPSAPPVDLAFDPGRDQILLLTADDVVRVIDDAGRVVERRESPLVEGATAIAFLER